MCKKRRTGETDSGAPLRASEIHHDMIFDLGSLK